MEDKRSQKRAGSSRYIVVSEVACLRIYFVYKESRVDFIKNVQRNRFPWQRFVKNATYVGNFSILLNFDVVTNNI